MKRLVLVPVENDETTRLDIIESSMASGYRRFAREDQSVGRRSVNVPRDDQLRHDLDMLTVEHVADVNEDELDDLSDSERKFYHAAQRLRIAAGLRTSEGEGLMETTQELYRALDFAKHAIRNSKPWTEEEKASALRTIDAAMSKARRAADE